MSKLDKWLAEQATDIQGVITQTARNMGLIGDADRITVSLEQEHGLPELMLPYGVLHSSLFSPVRPAALGKSERERMFRLLTRVRDDRAVSALRVLLTKHSNLPTLSKELSGDGVGCSREAVNNALKNDWGAGPCYRLLMASRAWQLWEVRPK